MHICILLAGRQRGGNFCLGTAPNGALSIMLTNEKATLLFVADTFDRPQ